MDQKDTFLKLINRLIPTLRPFKLDEFNKFLIECGKGSLEELEEKVQPVEQGWSITVVSLIATVSNTFVDESLTFIVNEDGFVMGAQ